MFALQTRSTRLKKRDERDELDIASPVLCDEENFTYLHLQKLRIRRGILAWFLRRVSQICQAYQHFVIGSGPLSDGLWSGVGHAQSSCTCYTIRAVCLTHFLCSMPSCSFHPSSFVPFPFALPVLPPAVEMATCSMDTHQELPDGEKELPGRLRTRSKT